MDEASRLLACCATARQTHAALGSALGACRYKYLLERLTQRTQMTTEASGPLDAALAAAWFFKTAHGDALDELESACTAETALFACVSRFQGPKERTHRDYNVVFKGALCVCT